MVFFLNRLRGKLYLNGWQYPRGFPYRLSVITQVGGFLYANKKGGDWIMAFNEELDLLLKGLTEEANNFKEAENPEEEKEALKDMLDIFMRGTQSVREHIDRYNERRWNR